MLDLKRTRLMRQHRETAREGGPGIPGIAPKAELPDYSDYSQAMRSRPCAYDAQTMRSRSTVYSANTRTAPLAVGAALRGNQTRGEEVRPEDGQRRPMFPSGCANALTAVGSLHRHEHTEAAGMDEHG